MQKLTKLVFSNDYKLLVPLSIKETSTKIDDTIEEFECIRCGKKVKMQIVGKLEEKICGECWCKRYKGGVK